MKKSKKRHRQIIKKIFVREKVSFFVGGTASYAAYCIVVWACLYLPIAVVSSVREISILFAVFLGLLFLKERLDFFKISLIVGLFSGLIFLRLG